MEPHGKIGRDQLMGVGTFFTLEKETQISHHDTSQKLPHEQRNTQNNRPPTIKWNITDGLSSNHIGIGLLLQLQRKLAMKNQGNQTRVEERKPT